jgi:hypothetical protein
VSSLDQAVKRILAGASAKLLHECAEGTNSRSSGALREDQKQSADKLSAERTRLQSRLTAIRHRMDAAYVEKLDGKISEDFWHPKMSEWQIEEHQVRMAFDGLAGAETGDPRPRCAESIRTREQGLLCVPYAKFC